MARPAKGNESKQGLVISLVFSIILTLSMGVTAYFGFADQARLDDEKQTALKDKASMAADRDWQKFQNILLKADLGLAMSEDEKLALPALRKRYDEGDLAKKGNINKDDAENVEKMVKRLDTEVQWDKNKNQPMLAYLKQIENLTKERDVDKKKSAEIILQSEAAAKKSAELVKVKEAELAKLKEEFVKAQKAIAGAKDDKSEQFLQATKELEARATKIEELTKETEKIKEELEKKIEKLTKDKKDLEVKYQTIQVKIAPIDLLAHDSPKGKILSLDRTGAVAYINLGSADNVRPQLTFSVFGVSASGKADKARKAALEVVNVLEPHMSMARISDVVNPNRDPVLTGDLLFNPSWSPTLKQHIAVAGLIDLTGDGTDSSLEFMRNLERQNIVVDAYLDMRDPQLAFRGKMSYKTNYLVLGEIPEFGAADVLNKNDPRVERTKEVLNKLSEIQNEAGRLGITIVPARRFMTLIGYRIPKTVRPPDYMTKTFPGAAPPAVKNDKPNGEAPPKEKGEMPKEKDAAKEKEKDDK